MRSQRFHPFAHLALLLGLLGAAAAAMAAPAAVAPATTLTGRPVSEAELHDWLEAARVRHGIPGLALATLEDGQLRSEIVLGVADVATGTPVTADTRFEAASLSKPVFSRWWMQSVDAGRVALDAPLAERPGELGLGEDPRVASLTARMLLSHQGGLPNWREPEGGSSVSFLFDPGRGFHYSGEGYDALGRVLARARGMDERELASRFAEEVAAPLGLRHFGFMVADCETGKAAPHRGGTRLPYTACPNRFGAAWSLESTAGDYARWLGAAMAGQGLSPGNDSAWWQAQGVALAADDPARALGLVDWSLGFARHEFPFGAVWLHGGNQAGYTALAMVTDDRRRGVVLLTNADSAQAFLIELVGFLAGASED